ncbi:conserved hypothetical protein [Culex quinquefasciatus]|uniref:Cuticle protein n=1 Tax=Culex quinquefasciatus TaxID=7176 RepID=B0XKD2_CULQU|nr:conserved hypothetical protein [Culex quinquefasciatus]|eukprot:XP_001870104.1 conserved hypothetical protein [Culex quinquefasciatus]
MSSNKCAIAAGLLLVIAVGMTLAAPQKPAEQQQLPVKDGQFNAAKSDPQGSTARNNERKLRKNDDGEETLEEIQAKSAQYSYDSSIDDSIMDQKITRQETREGLALKGMYAYSDGFYKREVHYVADEKGYRVVKEISIPIGDGPQVDPNGKADVSSSLSGKYSITADDIARPIKKNAKKVV